METTSDGCKVEDDFCEGIDKGLVGKDSFPACLSGHGDKRREGVERHNRDVKK